MSQTIRPNQTVSEDSAWRSSNYTNVSDNSDSTYAYAVSGSSSSIKYGFPVPTYTPSTGETAIYGTTVYVRANVTNTYNYPYISIYLYKGNTEYSSVTNMDLTTTIQNFAIGVTLLDGFDDLFVVVTTGGGSSLYPKKVYDVWITLPDADSSSWTEPATDITTWTDPTLSDSINIKATHLSELRTALNDEVTRRSKTALSWTYGVQSTGDTCLAVNFKEYKDQIDYVRNNYDGTPTNSAFSWSSTYDAGNKITATMLAELRTNINDLENDCICNCNYCTCVCNYCTCNCNYFCTCNCNYNG